MQSLTVNQRHEVTGGVSSDLATLGGIVVGAGIVGAAEGAALSCIGVCTLGIGAAAITAGIVSSAFILLIMAPASFLEPAHFWGMAKKDLFGE